MNVTADIKARVKAKLEESIATAEAHYGTTFPMPTILYNKRGTTAGTANYVRNEVNFNAVLLMENTEDFLARTVPHEMAHLIDHKLHPENFESGGVRVTRTGRVRRGKRTVHGPTWQSIMRVLGAPTSRCHSYDTSSARVRTKARHEWACTDCGATMTLGPGRHKKMWAAGTRGAYRPRGKGCSWDHTYHYVGLEGAAAPAALAEAANREGERRAAREAKKSKLDKCRELYDWTESRQWNVNQFIVGAGCTTAGAATYYARIKKGY